MNKFFINKLNFFPSAQQGDVFFIKKIRTGFLILAGFLLSHFSFLISAQQMPESYRQCIVCHGEQGQGNTQLKSPALAGQSANYLNRQLLNFTNGLRGSHEKDMLGMQMVAISKKLDLNKEVPQITTFLAALPSPTIAHKITGDLKNGDRYYQARCGACHGGQAQGNPSMNSPKLSGQSIDYLRRQMINFSTGIRGTHKDDKLGRQMAMMSKTSSGKELEDIFYYISTQK